MAGALPGYSRIPGSSRRYLTPTGESISRREYDNLRAQLAGFRNRYEVEQFRRREAGSDWFGHIYSAQGRGPTWENYADLRDVKSRRAALRAQHGPGSNSELDKLDPALVAADGPLARVLDAAGKRPMSGRPVGSS